MVWQAKHFRLYRRANWGTAQVLLGDNSTHAPKLNVTTANLANFLSDIRSSLVKKWMPLPDSYSASLDSLEYVYSWRG
jgi:hypothetical protein